MSNIHWILAALGVLLAVVVTNLLDSLRPFKAPLPVNDASRCQLLRGPIGAEDMVLTEHGWIITSSMDSGRLIDHGVDACGTATGGLWALHANDTKKAPSRIAIQGLPSKVASCFMTHGLFLSNTTNRLYAVTHHGDYSFIEVFDVHHDQQQDDKPALTWVRSITSDSFINFGPNDVVEGVNGNEVYVTQFLPFSIPKKGRQHPETLLERVQQALLLPIFFLGMKLSQVHCCTFVDDPLVPAVCSVAAGRFRGANGIAISNDRTTIYVNDLMSHALVVLKRQDDSGMLLKTDTIPLQHAAADNIEYKTNPESGAEEIWMGTIPGMMVVANNEEKPFEERAIVPGGLAVVTKNRDGKWGEQRIVYNHDGSVLSQVSFGISYNNKIFLGSAYAKGILVCDDENVASVF